MNLIPQTTPEATRLGGLIEHIPVAMLTTADDAGALLSRPMSPLEMDADGALWFFTDRRSSKVEHLRVLNLCFADVGRSCYVSIAGHGELHDERALIERLWTPFARPWFPDGPESPELVLLKVVPETAEFWDAPASKMVRVLAMAASVVAGQPIAMGAHERYDALWKPASAPGLE